MEQMTKFKLNLNQFKSRCLPIINGLMERVCWAAYPEEIHIKYMDRFMEAKEPYAIFQLEHERSHYFIALGSSKLLRCLKLKILSGSRFWCKTDESSENEIVVGHSGIACLPFHLQYTDDLLKTCLPEEQPKSSFTTLFYSHADAKIKRLASSDSSRITWDYQLCLLSLVGLLLLWIFMRVWQKKF